MYKITEFQIYEAKADSTKEKQTNVVIHRTSSKKKIDKDQ